MLKWPTSGELMFSQRGSRYSNMISLTLSVPLQTARDARQEREVAARLEPPDEGRVGDHAGACAPSLAPVRVAYGLSISLPESVSTASILLALPGTTRTGR